jgi:hypothetical protein
LQKGYYPSLSGQNNNLFFIVSTITALLVAGVYTLAYGIMIVKIWTSPKKLADTTSKHSHTATSRKYTY